MNKNALVFIGALFSSGFLHAALIDNGTFTTDTETGIEWLDLTATAGLNYEEVSAQLGTGGAYEGWHYATLSQVEQFIGHAGGVGPYDGYSSGFNAVVPQLQSLWGISRLWPDHAQSWALTGTSPTGGSDVVHTVYLVDEYDNTYYDDTINTDVYWSKTRDCDVYTCYAGSALIRGGASTVPLPAAFWLFGAAIAGLAGLKRSISE